MTEYVIKPACWVPNNIQKCMPWSSVTIRENGDDALVVSHMDDGTVVVDSLPDSAARDTVQWLMVRTADYTVTTQE